MRNQALNILGIRLVTLVSLPPAGYHAVIYFPIEGDGFFSKPYSFTGGYVCFFLSDMPNSGSVAMMGTIRGSWVDAAQ